MRKNPSPPAPNPLPASVTTPTSVSARRANAAEAAPSGSGTHTYIVASGVSGSRSEEHTSELQSRLHLVCRLLLEKKKTKAHDGAVHSEPRPPQTTYETPPWS